MAMFERDSSGLEDLDQPLLDEDVYKTTSSDDLVVLRRVKLYKTKFVTFHDYQRDSSDRREWYLDRRCELQPRNASDIREPSLKTVRPPGTWTLTAMIKSTGQTVQLYQFTINWSTRWMKYGYSSFTFGFRTPEEARHWHSRLSECIALLRRDEANGMPLPPAPSSRRGTSRGANSSPKPPASSDVSGTGLNRPEVRPSGGSKSSPHKPAEQQQQQQQQQQEQEQEQEQEQGSTSGSGQPVSVPDPASKPPKLEPAAGTTTGTAARALYPGGCAVGDAAGTTTGMNFSNDDDDDDNGGLGAGLGAGPGLCDASGASVAAMQRGLRRSNLSSDVQAAARRWVPYKHLHGMAIYRHNNTGDDCCAVGGEFMVSTVVRGSPTFCRNVLLCNTGNTTILGPAQELEVLSPRCAGQGKEVVRIVLGGMGLAGMVCAPRELIVETVLKVEASGPTYVIMFNSCEAPARILEPGLCGSGASATTGAVAGEESGGQQRMLVRAANSRTKRWFSKPVAARVAGGYTIAPMQGHSLDASPESLVTVIMKMDLGGACSDRSWLRPFSEAMGLLDGFVESFMLALTLLRDEVEHDRFAVQPLQMITTGGIAAQDERAAAAAAAAAAPAVGRAASGTLPQQQHRIAAGAASRAASVSQAAAAIDTASGASVRRLASVQDASSAVLGDKAAAAAAANVSAFRKQQQDGFVDTDKGVGFGGGAMVQEQEVYDGPLVDYERLREIAYLTPQTWDNLHQPGKDAPFKVRGPTYLKDRKKIPAGMSKFVLGAMNVISLPEPTQHVARFLPSVRDSGAPFSFIINLIIPGNPLLGIVAVFVSEWNPRNLGEPPAHPMEDDHDWEPFDFVMHKYLNGSPETRARMLKLIPHIADGSWMIKQSVGTTPVILGKQLRTTYYETPQYIEVDIDISCNQVAAYVTGLVRGATRSLVIDMGFVLEGTTPWELPEVLLGTLRLNYLNVAQATPLDISKELPLRPAVASPPPPHHRRPTTTSQPQQPEKDDVIDGRSSANSIRSFSLRHANSMSLGGLSPGGGAGGAGGAVSPSAPRNNATMSQALNGWNGPGFETTAAAAIAASPSTTATATQQQQLSPAAATGTGTLASPLAPPSASQAAAGSGASVSRGLSSRAMSGALTVSASASLVSEDNATGALLGTSSEPTQRPPSASKTPSSSHKRSGSLLSGFGFGGGGGKGGDGIGSGSVSAGGGLVTSASYTPLLKGAASVSAGGVVPGSSGGGDQR